MILMLLRLREKKNDAAYTIWCKNSDKFLCCSGSGTRKENDAAPGGSGTATVSYVEPIVMVLYLECFFNKIAILLYSRFILSVVVVCSFSGPPVVPRHCVIIVIQRVTSTSHTVKKSS
jgi:hypothetical protein